MSEDSPKYGLQDENGVIRYDWPTIQLQWTTGVSAADIAKSLTQDCQERYETVRNTIAVRALRNGWREQADNARKLISGNPRAISGHLKASNALSIDVIGGAANVAIRRKNSYLDGLSEFGDRSVKLLRETDVGSLEEASKVALYFDPIHRIMKDVHGLNAKEPVAAVQVNFLSGGSSGVVLDDEQQADT